MSDKKKLYTQTDAHGNEHVVARTEGKYDTLGDLAVSASELATTGGASDAEGTAATAAETRTFSRRALIENYRAQRIEELKANGALEASATSDPLNPRSTNGIDDWWEMSHISTEVRKGESYDVMPDDYTPGQTLGRSALGNRRTHRMKYEVGGATLRMPSVAANKRFSAEVDGRTYDMPVEADSPHGSFIGHVRVSRGVNGTWDVEVPGTTPETAERDLHVAEAVRATLEARRPTRPVAKDQKALYAQRAERLAKIGAIPGAPKVESSLVKGIGYNPYSRQAVVDLNGKVYGYDLTKTRSRESEPDLDPKLKTYARLPEKSYVPTEADNAAHVKAIYSGSSPGKAYNDVMKFKYEGTGLASQCDKCTAYYNAGTEHVCRTQPTERKAKLSLSGLIAQKAAFGDVMTKNKVFRQAYKRVRNRERPELIGTR